MDPEVRIFVYREGLLSRLGHDLQLSARQFEVHVEDRAITGRFWSDMIRVDGALERGRCNPGGLSTADRSRIEQTIREEVLHSDTNPEIVFEGAVQPLAESAEYAVEGQLRMLATERSITLTVFARDGMATAEVMLTPSMWGIRPYRALGGTLRLKDRVKVVVELPMKTGAEEEAPMHWSSRGP